MKASEWIQMIWDTVPDAVKISHGGTSVWVRGEKGKPIMSIPIKSLRIDRDVPLQATRPSVTERLSIEKDDDNWRGFCYKDWDDIPLASATSFANFLGYELADGTMSPRLEAGMDVVAVHFEKEN